MFKGIPIFPSRLGRLVFILNLLGLLVLVIGALVLNEFSKGLIVTKKESLSAQAALMGDVMAEVATQGEPEPRLEPIAAIIMSRFVEKGQRARLYDIHGHLLVDSAQVSDDIDQSVLPPARQHGPNPEQQLAQADKRWALRHRALKSLEDEVDRALKGNDVAEVRRDEHDRKVVSVVIPLRRVAVVLGALQLESGGVDEIVGRQRLALLPFILVALLVNIASSLALNRLVSHPVQRLSAAADSVRLQKVQTMELPDIERRRDEIGLLARSLRTMTATLSRRMTEIERFAADVSHEIKNPLTSIRSALETLGLVKDEAAKTQLLGVIRTDVLRLDRLITDISNASRLDADLSREMPQPVNLCTLLEDVVSLYRAQTDMVPIKYDMTSGSGTWLVNGYEGPLGQVLRNLIDNARSFSPEDGAIRIHLGPDPDDPGGRLSLQIDDDGPGIPEENLETVFQRFYTSRPKGSRFGRNSGLGLSISRQIIEAHHGLIYAQNRKTDQGHIEGARFCILLPRLYRLG